MSRRTWQVLLAVAGAMLVIRVVVALALPNLAWPDEVFQTSEQAHRVAFGDGLVPWEFREGARSWLLPGALAIVFRLTGPLCQFAGTIVLALGSLIPIVCVYRAAARRTGLKGSALPSVGSLLPAAAVAGSPDSGLPSVAAGSLLPAVVAAIVVGAWFELVYFGPKALNEVVAGHLLVGAVFLVGRDAPIATRRIAIAGAMTALAIALRVHLAPCGLVLFGLAWKRGKFLPFVLGAAGVAAFAGVLDWITWGAPFASYVETIRFNLIEGRSALFGTSPWWSYVTTVGGVWNAGGLLVLALAVVGARRDPWPLVLALVVLVTHSLIGHKEYRFIAPAIMLAIYSAGLGAADLAVRVGPRATVFGVAAWCAMSFVTGLRVDTAMTRMGAPIAGLEADVSQFASQRDGLVIMKRARELDSLCGLALVEVPWYATGGYTWLHRSVPMEAIFSPRALAAETPALDAVIAPKQLAIPTPYTRITCEGMLCLWHRDGACTKPAKDMRDALGDPSPSAVQMP